MENILFERDYSSGKSHNKNSIDDCHAMKIFDCAVESGFFQAYSDAMRKLPKIINPLRKANFEYVQNICDDMAKRWGGKIRAEVRYDKWDAIIDLILPFIEFGSPEDLLNLAEISQRVDSATFSPSYNGGVRLHIFCYYFDDVASQKEMDDILLHTVTDRPDLLKALLLKMEMDGEDIKGEYEKYFGSGEP